MKGGENVLQKKILIAGLGNPGTKYEFTRHNLGWKVIDLLSNVLGASVVNQHFYSKSIKTMFLDKKIILLCPQTHMNQSGFLVMACAKYHKIASQNILIIHDDLDLPVGRLKVIQNGGAGGHKGVLSIIRYLGTKNFARIKMGIGRPRYGEAIEDFVLSGFYKDQKGIIEKALNIAIQACEFFILDGIELAMNRINCQNFANMEGKQ